MSIKGIIFDLDGTLLDSMTMWHDVDRRFLERYDITPPEGFSDRIRALSFKESSELFVREFRLPCTPEEVMDGIFNMVEGEYRLTLPLKSGAEEFLLVLDNKKLPYCIATATCREWAESCLERLKLSDRIKFMLTCDEVGKSKDDPRIFKLCAERLNLSPEEIIVVEDSFHGIQSAKSAEFYTVGIYDSASERESEMIKGTADFFVKDFYELIEAFDKLPERKATV